MLCLDPGEGLLHRLSPCARLKMLAMAMARQDVLAFEVAMEAEAMQHVDENGIVSFPRSRKSLARLPFGFLGYF